MKSSSQARSGGFTLIELMIVVAIIGILASIALPSYQNYTIRAKVTEGIVLTTEIKAEVLEYYRHKERFPRDNAQAGVPQPDKLLGNYVSGITVADGAVHVEFGNKVGQSLKGKMLSLRPIVVDGSPESPVSWVCGRDPAPEGMSAVGEDRTTVEDRFLPAACRN